MGGRHLGILVAVVAILALVAAGCRDDPDADEVLPLGSAAEEIELRVDGRDRVARVFVPDSADDEGAPAAVLVLHGGAGTIDGTVEQTGFDAEAAEEGFLTVYPRGTPSKLRLVRLEGYVWNAGGCCGEAADEDVDDVAFLVELIDTLVADYGVDPGRVYATGISNGGMMAYRLACDAADRVAAVAPVAATLFSECRPSEPVSLLHVHGLEDDNVRFDGGRNRRGLLRQDRPPVADGIEAFLDADDCAPTGTVEENAPVTVETWSACTADTTVELVTIADGGHSWPGGERLRRFLDAPSTSYDATDAIAAFFASHPREGPTTGPGGRSR